MLNTDSYPGTQLPVAERRTNYLLWALLATAGLLVIVIGSCTALVLRQGRIADAIVSELHEHMRAKRHDRILAMTDPAATPEHQKNFVEVFNLVDAKLGKPLNSERTNVLVQRTIEGKFLIATYSTKFEKGTGTETFTFRYIANRPMLYAYNVNSPHLK